MEGISILGKVKLHFESIGRSVNKAEIQNAVISVYAILKNERLAIDCIIAQLYPKEDFNDNKREEEKEEKEEKRKQ